MNRRLDLSVSNPESKTDVKERIALCVKAQIKSSRMICDFIGLGIEFDVRVPDNAVKSFVAD
jgi:hypothetical protein